MDDYEDEDLFHPLNTITRMCILLWIFCIVFHIMCIQYICVHLKFPYMHKYPQSNNNIFFEMNETSNKS